MNITLKKRASARQRLYSSGRGFTLIEVLVVIAIITILLTLGSFGLRNLTKTSGITAALPVAESLFVEARELAVGRATNTRVLIHATVDASDEYHRVRYLKYMAIAYEEQDEDGNGTGVWILSSQGTELPQGVYFDKTLSETNAPTLSTMTIQLPGKSDTTCYYYEFSSEGFITSPAISGNSVPKFILRVGTLRPGDTEPTASSKSPNNIGGFVIWRTGRTSIFRSVEQIEASNT